MKSTVNTVNYDEMSPREVRERVKSMATYDMFLRDSLLRNLNKLNTGQLVKLCASNAFKIIKTNDFAAFDELTVQGQF